MARDSGFAQFFNFIDEKVNQPIDDFFTGAGDFIGEQVGNITGANQAAAAEEAAAAQQQAALNAAQLTAQATALQREDLQPFTQFGSGFIDPAQQAVTQSQQLFSDPSSIMQTPFFQALQNQAQTDIMQNAAVRGRLDTGGTQQHLQDSALRTGFDILNQERNANLANVGMFQSLVNQGQSAAAGQGAATQFGNQIQTNQLTDAAAASAAGTIGAANASAQGTGNLLSLGSGFLNFGAPGTGGGNIVPSAPGVTQVRPTGFDASGFGGFGAGL